MSPFDVDLIRAADENEKNQQREQCGLDTYSKSSRWPLHLVREAIEKNAV